MNQTIEIKDGDELLARFIPESEAWVKGLKFCSEDKEFIQVGIWGYEKGKELKPHIHNKVTREVAFTQEVIFVKQGSIKADIFNKKEKKIAEIVLTEGDLIILISGGHGYKILEDNTKVLEVKNGPYVGAEADRRRI